MKKFYGLAAIAAGVFVAASAHAQSAPTIIVTPTLAPNAFGSPSYNPWVDNSVYAQSHALTTYGTANSPTQYNAQNVVTATESIVTGFPSWKGVADPGTAFGAQYANELGNRMAFGIYINGNGTQFSIDGLTFSAASSDAGHILGFGFGAGSYGYSNDYRGILKGIDGVLGTADDVYVTSGLATQLVDAFVGRGSGNSLAAYCPGCTIAQQQQAIDDAAAYFTGPTTFTGTYTLGNTSGSNSFLINPSVTAGVPEPTTWAMMMLGFGLIGAAVRRRRSDEVAALA
jgi:hypothetical protein